MLWWWATPFTLQRGVPFQWKLAYHMKCLIKHIWFIILIIILIITSSLYKLLCQQQDKPAVSYTKSFTHYFETCFIILLLTHPFIWSDGNSLTLPGIKIVYSSFFIWTFSCPFYEIGLHIVHPLFHLCSLFFCLSYFSNLFFSLNRVTFPAFFSRAQIQSHLSTSSISSNWQSNSAQRLLSLMKTALHLLHKNISTKNIPGKT